MDGGDHTIHLLGTGASSPDPDRAPSAVLVKGGGTGSLLIDAGDGVARSLAKPEYAGVQVSSIVLTHNHPDHIGGLPHLLQGMKGEPRSMPLEIFAPPVLATALPIWLAPLRLAIDRMPFPIKIIPLQETTLVTSSGHSISFWETDHFADDELGDRCFGATLHLPGGNWVLSSDLKSLKPLRPQLSKARGLIVESAHIDPQEATSAAKQAGVETIVLTHIPKGTPISTIDGAQWATDGMVLDTGSSREDEDE